MDPMIFFLPALAILWAISRITGPVKVAGMTPERREKVARMRRFQDRHAALKSHAGASEPAVYGLLTPEQTATYQATRERLKKAA